MERSVNTEINIYSTPEEMFAKAADEICSLINYYLNEFNRCSVVLSGGNTPKKLFEILGKEYNERIKWGRVFFFWGDERCVPPDDDESNYKMAKEYLFSFISVPDSNIFRILGEKPPEEAAAKYEAALKHFFEGQAIPQFDLILLGIGNDGHTASLFPGTTAIDTTDKWVDYLYVEKLKSWRITLTFPVINKAKNILFIVDGKGKSEIINKI